MLVKIIWTADQAKVLVDGNDITDSIRADGVSVEFGDWPALPTVTLKLIADVDMELEVDGPDPAAAKTELVQL